MITEAIRIASEVFWSSSISLRIEKGLIFTMTKNAIAKKTNPINVKTSVVTTVFKKGSVGIIYLPGIQSARNGMIDSHRANAERRPAGLHVLAFRSPSPERLKLSRTAILQFQRIDISFSRKTPMFRVQPIRYRRWY